MRSNAHLAILAAESSHGWCGLPPRVTTWIGSSYVDTHAEAKLGVDQQWIVGAATLCSRAVRGIIFATVAAAARCGRYLVVLVRRTSVESLASCDAGFANEITGFDCSKIRDALRNSSWLGAAR